MGLIGFGASQGNGNADKALALERPFSDARSQRVGCSVATEQSLKWLGRSLGFSAFRQVRPSQPGSRQRLRKFATPRFYVPSTAPSTSLSPPLDVCQTAKLLGNSGSTKNSD